MDILSFVFQEHLHNGYWFYDEEDIPFIEAQERLNTLLIDRMLIKPESSILDVGCGIGHFACRIANAAASCKVTGIDISEDEVQRGNQLVRTNQLAGQVTIQCGDMTHLPFDNQTFDRVSAIESVCCVEDREKAMQEIARIMVKKGRLIMADFVKERDLTERQQVLLRAETLISYLSPKDSVELFKRTGFRLVEFTDISGNTDKSYEIMLTKLKSQRPLLIEHLGVQEVTHLEAEWSELTKIHQDGYFSYRLIVAERLD